MLYIAGWVLLDVIFCAEYDGAYQFLIKTITDMYDGNSLFQNFSFSHLILWPSKIK